MDAVEGVEAHRALEAVEREGAGCYHFRELGPPLSEPLVVSHVLDVAAGFATKRKKGD